MVMDIWRCCGNQCSTLQLLQGVFFNICSGSMFFFCILPACEPCQDKKKTTCFIIFKTCKYYLKTHFAKCLFFPSKLFCPSMLNIVLRQDSPIISDLSTDAVRSWMVDEFLQYFLLEQDVNTRK